MRKVSLGIKKTKIGGEVYYQVTTPNPEGGRPKRKTFKSREDAKTHLQSVKMQVENYGAAAFGISDSLRTDAVRAAEILKETGATLTEAARFFLKDFKSRKNGILVSDAVDKFLEKRKGLNATHVATLKSRLAAFSAAAEELTTTSITSDQITGFLDSLPVEPRTRLHYWVHLNSLFTFCMGREWCFANPMHHVERPVVVDKEIQILTPAECADILNACDDRLLAGVVIGMFCGLRQSEIERLDWQSVDLKEGHIRLAAAQVKTKARRVVPIPPCAKGWLALVQKPAGMVWPQGESTRDAWTKTRLRAGFGPFKPTSAEARDLQTDPKTGKPRENLKPWPANALRHSAISYKLAQSPDLARIAYESGNSPDVIRTHYNGLATPKQAAAFFALTAPDQSKIVRMSA